MTCIQVKRRRDLGGPPRTADLTASRQRGIIAPSMAGWTAGRVDEAIEDRGESRFGDAAFTGEQAERHA
jgi:hypothetical protein